jgi:DNA-binding SARP family transcriptional activator
VLALLSLRGRASREAICALLWPDSPPEAARSSLSSALSALRRDLGEEALVADRHAVALAPGAVSTDVAVFDRALKQEDWECAVESYRGHLLPGFHEEPFPSLAAEYEEKARGAFSARLQVLEGEAQAEPLRSLARRAAQLFGDEERWFLSLMRAHRMSGDVEAGLRSYEALQRWARKNGEAASEEARALAKQLRRDKEKLAAQAPQVLEEPEEDKEDALSSEEVSAPALNLPSQWTRFFGREAERELLRAWLDAGQKFITLSGAGGSGKTRLAIETVREAAPAWSGVHFVPLASLSDAGLLFSTIRDSLGMTAGSDLPPLEQIERALKNQKCLLLLDNFEQLAERGAPLLQKLRERLPERHLPRHLARLAALAGRARVSRSPAAHASAKYFSAGSRVLAQRRAVPRPRGHCSGQSQR